ncbi:MAG: PTS sugar transporter subunit IIB [Streptococcaceae bacterium]|jgi:PTS system mannose-specific IIB component/fructoselysine and glucoselysine-specific PTS system IIB component|nr:PTS sugar transporter subunit IIB [Streptococcaceae bacterium]
MITLLRVDDRLIHGQVAMTWTSYLSANVIVVANDKYAKDPFLQMALNLAKPPGVALNIVTKDEAVKFCNDPANDSSKIFIVVETTDDAVMMAENIPGIKEAVLGGIRKAEGRVQMERQVFLSRHDIDNAEKIDALGKKVSVQVVPSDKELSLADMKKIYSRKSN